MERKNAKSAYRTNQLRLLIAGYESVADFARKFDLDQTYIRQILNGHRPFGEKSAAKIGLKVSGNANFFEPPLSEVSYIGNGNISIERCDLIPLLSWPDVPQCLKAGLSGMAIRDVGRESVICPLQERGQRTFAIKVLGDSMDSQTGRSYPEGTMLFVDPDVTPKPGSKVLAVINGDTTTFKVLSEDVGAKFLRSLNPQYPIIFVGDNVEIVGTVIAALYEEN